MFNNEYIGHSSGEARLWWYWLILWYSCDLMWFNLIEGITLSPKQRDQAANLSMKTGRRQRFCATCATFNMCWSSRLETIGIKRPNRQTQDNGDMLSTYYWSCFRSRFLDVQQSFQNFERHPILCRQVSPKFWEHSGKLLEWTRFRQPGSGKGGWQKVGWNRLWYRCFGKQNREVLWTKVSSRYWGIPPELSSEFDLSDLSSLSLFWRSRRTLQLPSCRRTKETRLRCHDVIRCCGVGISLVSSFRLCFSCFICASMFHHVSQECRRNPSFFS